MKAHRKSGLTRGRILRTLKRNRDLLDRYSVRQVALFGSYAAGRQTDKSDLDFLVEFGQPTYDNFLGLSRELEKLFGRKVDILTPEGLDSIRAKSVAAGIRATLAYV